MTTDMELHLFFSIGIMLVAGLCFGRLAKKLKLPNVTGYLVAGLVIGPFVLNIVPQNTVSDLSFVSEAALGFIALSIGGEFKLSYFKRVGAMPVIIAVFEGVIAMAFVTIALCLAGFTLQFALVLGAIASATAPAATIMVIRQYRAKGPVTETLMSVVALDDAVALISFGFAVAIAQSMNTPGVSVVQSILQPFAQVSISLGLGAGLGFLLNLPMRFFKKDSNRMCAMIAFVLIAIALADLTGASSLLTCMALGAVFINACPDAPAAMKITDYITPPVFMLFFVLSGASLDITILPSLGIVGVIYILMRIAGKITGSWLGATISKAPAAVRKYLGPALIPQAGVAIGLSLLAEQVVPDYAAQIRAVVLCATLVYELIGPVISKITLQKAGEIQKTA